MNNDTQAELLSIEANYTRELAQERLQNAINTLQRCMYDMESYLERLETAGSYAERAWVMNGAIKHLVCNIQPNLRIDLLANSQAELATLAAKAAAE